MKAEMLRPHGFLHTAVNSEHSCQTKATKLASTSAQLQVSKFFLPVLLLSGSSCLKPNQAEVTGRSRECSSPEAAWRELATLLLRPGFSAVGTADGLS